MRTLTLLGFALACITCLSCSTRSTSPMSQAGGPEPGGESSGQVQVYVYWEDQPLADRQLEIVELGLAKRSDAEGLASFELPPGTYTLRSYVTSPGPAAYVDQRVTIEPGETESVKVQDCLPCLSPN